MTRRAMTGRPQINHLHAADGLREMPGLWLPVGRYSSRYAAMETVRHVKAGTLMAYAPAGSFDARVEYDAEGEPVLVACYLGQPAQAAA